MIVGIVVKNDNNKIKGELSASDQESISASTPDGCTFYQGVDFDRERLKYAFYDGVKVTYEKTSAQTQAETDWRRLRQQRDEMLIRSDWTQSPDSPLTDAKKTEWRIYRQSLRDITETSDLTNVTWPTQPS